VSVLGVFRIAAARGSRFAPGSWDETVGKSTPVRVMAPATPQGWATSDTVCTSVDIAEDGSHADLHLTVWAVDDPGLVIGLFVESEVISVTTEE
jgi:hypothetical protein